MPRFISVGSAIDKNKLSSGAVWCVLLKIDIVDPNLRDVTETLYIANNNENVIYNGDVYQVGNFDIKIDQKAGQSPNCTITAQDQTRYIQQRMEEMAGGVFSNVTMLVVNLARIHMPAEFEERFQIISASTKDYVVTFQLGAENPLAVQFPKHKQWKDRCAWRFKGYGCGYTGAATKCDYTKDGANGCAVKSNTHRFRGLPGLVRMNI